MRIVIAYESIYGNTRRVAEAIASGVGDEHDVRTIPISAVGLDDLGVNLLVVGVPTHAHGLPRPSTRRAALESAHTRYDDHPVDAAAGGSGVREWLERLPRLEGLFVTSFDTRFRPPGWLVGHPARHVSRALARRGAVIVARPQSFFVDKREQLRPGELDRARGWGGELSLWLSTRDGDEHGRGAVSPTGR